jgi:hypothetical protein
LSEHRAGDRAPLLCRAARRSRDDAFDDHLIIRRDRHEVEPIVENADEEDAGSISIVRTSNEIAITAISAR